jgi:hypothetical protein
MLLISKRLLKATALTILKEFHADVYNYLNELIENDCLGYEIKETSNAKL